MLTGRNWARWLAMVWIAFHLVVSAFHPVGELTVHVVLFCVFAGALFHHAAAQYFAAVKEPAPGGHPQ
jgi:hypothetical protein